MTSCMSSKRSNQLSYASERILVYHIFPNYARAFLKKVHFLKLFRKVNNSPLVKSPKFGIIKLENISR